jgi:hypothetical protein
VGRCAGEGGLLVVAGAVGEVIEVHGVVEELLSAMVGSERVRRRLATEKLLAARLKRMGMVVEADEASCGGVEGGDGVEGGIGGKIFAA